MTAKTNPKVKHSVDGSSSGSNGVGAPLGNQNGVKFKNDEIKRIAYKSYCDWIALGETKEAWTFEHDSLTCTHRTMEKYIANDPIGFPPIHKELAEAKSYCHWLKLGKGMMLGQIEKCQPAIFQMFMRNKFKWDKDDLENVAACAADKILERLTQK